MLCPNCNTALKRSNRLGVEIDLCPDCRGIWLDRGELEKIIEEANREEKALEEAFGETGKMPETDRFPVYPNPDERRKRSFFSDLFDFD